MQSKSGSLIQIQIDEANKIKIGHQLDLEEGVLSIKYESKDKYSMGCSNGDIQVITLHDNEDKLTKEVNQVYKLEEQKVTNVCLMHDTTENLIAGCY